MATRLGLLTDNGAALSSDTFPVATANDRLKDSSFTTTNLTASTYTPAVTNPINLDATASASIATWQRLGNTVLVAGGFSADPTSPSATTSFELSLPVTSSLSSRNELSGMAFSGAISEGAEIYASTASNTALITWQSVTTANQSWSYVYVYQVI